ncbi:MAG: C39 family peptidase [Methanoregula sp.]|uniref:C39 family peptidase n=1 Tax=Methanoregula sp. TaxID=2052170 RepID=UPI003D0FDD9B
MHRSLPLLIISLALFAGVIVSAGCVQNSASPQDLHNQTVTGSATVPGLLDQVPDVRQSQSYSCGAASLQAVFSYWGIDQREGMLIQELNTTEATGTPPESIVRVARAHGLEADLRTNLTLTDLEQSLAGKVPVIIACQAWRDPGEANRSWDDTWEDGHYMVVIGMDSSNVYFEDPAMLGTRGVIPRQEFLSRWHDYEGDAPFSKNSTVLNHAGIFIRGKEPAAYPEFTHVD